MTATTPAVAGRISGGVVSSTAGARVLEDDAVVLVLVAWQVGLSFLLTLV